MKIIKERIKELGMSVEDFCKKQGHKYSDFGSKQRTVESKLNWLNEFLEPLGLEVVIKRKL
jgi:hypothetical protein